MRAVVIGGTGNISKSIVRVLEALDRAGRIPDSDTMRWEDDLIAMALAIRNYRIDT